MYIILYNSNNDRVYRNPHGEIQMREYQAMAYAKINLGLDVVRRLENGYHQVKMVMQSIGLGDQLTLEMAGCGITITTDAPGLPTDRSNLIHKAASLMFETYGIHSGIRVHLRKEIPMAAGMAGGSTDAAAVMKGINELFRLGLPLSRLMEDGVAIGADVPYCILGGTALAEGIGERLTALPPMPDCHILVAKPRAEVSTKYVYEHLDAQGLTAHPDIDGMVQAIRQGDLQGITGRMENVLETVTVPAHPVIADLKGRMLESGAENSLMSGSGPTVFGIFSEEEKARAAYARLREENLTDRLFLTEPCRNAD